jgi:hypothetical protein
LQLVPAQASLPYSVKCLRTARARRMLGVGAASGERIHCLNPSWGSKVSITSQEKVSSTSRPPTTAFPQSPQLALLFTFKAVFLLHISISMSPSRVKSAQPTHPVREILDQNMQVPPVCFIIWNLDSTICRSCYLQNCPYNCRSNRPWDT